MNRKEQIHIAMRESVTETICSSDREFSKTDIDLLEAAWKKSAEWADKTMIDKACEWLFKNTYKHVDDSRVHMTFTYTVDMIEDFRKAMEE